MTTERMGVNPLAVIGTLASIVRTDNGNRYPGINALLDDAEHARAAVAELVDRAERVTATLEMPTLIKQSGKNANAGFLDMRDWCALMGEVDALRAALAPFQTGGAK